MLGHVLGIVLESHDVRAGPLVHFLFRDHPWAGGYKYSSSRVLSEFYSLSVRPVITSGTLVCVCVSVKRKVFNLSLFSGRR